MMYFANYSMKKILFFLYFVLWDHKTTLKFTKQRKIKVGRERGIQHSSMLLFKSVYLIKIQIFFLYLIVYKVSMP